MTAAKQDNLIRSTPTLRDIAAKIGVNPSTVSRVLNDDCKARISPSTRHKIKSLAQALNYRPNRLAQGLKLRQSYTIGMLIPDIGNPVFPEIIKGAESVAVDRDYALVLSHIAGDFTKKNAYRPLLLEKRVDGLLLATAQTEDEIYRDSAESGTPLVMINRRSDSAQNYVITDDSAGARMAVDHLVSLGHQRIVHLSGPLVTDTAVRRFHGYRTGLSIHGLPFNGDWVEECDFSWATGRKGLFQLLSRIEPPFAIFAANMMVAIGAMSGLYEMGIDVPKQVSVIGFHDAPLAEVVNPPLTVVKMPLFEMGAEGARNLIDAIESGKTPTRCMLPPSGLVLRGSTAEPC